MTQLAVYGGTFNPVHRAHVALAQYCQTTFSFQRIHLLPCALPAHKAAPVSAEHRLAMLRIAFAGQPEFILDERELRRGGASYTIDTARELRAEQGEQCALFFIVGADSWHSLDTWEDWQEILQMMNLIVVDRPGYRIADMLSGARPLSAQLQREWQLRLCADRHSFSHARAGKIFHLAMPLLDISSTAIRERIRLGDSTEGLLDPAVRQYIDRHQLYQQTTQALP